ncbi:VOC family protein [Mycolicibacterium holsaticum]|uniref:Glyoxalase n=1 Tax=Mycolicibacterium holsaticum TaxID=152142 RepID=A0A1E3R8I8_9MYCO|nr:VOC family protein [Mycolicibacterium holsaticum]ODQ86173.1 glyoxalase [Mycolicibacterium holsaticum]
MSRVTGLGYVLIDASDLDAWEKFACELLGLQAVVHTPERLVLRLDQKAYRVDIRRAETDAVSVIGWEVRGPRELEDLAVALEAGGYSVKRASSAAVRERLVSGLVEFDDPTGQRLELFWGLQERKDRFVSPTGARFVTGAAGLGHIFQMVHGEDAYATLYQDILGFKLSDVIDFGPGAAATFLHAGERHHSYAFAPLPGVPTGVGHLMLEVDDLDTVGRAWDKVRNGAAPLVLDFGKHTNDEMLSFYVKTPSGFEIEYGYGGKKIDDDTWTPARYDSASYWGHRHTVHTDPDAPDV